MQKEKPESDPITEPENVLPSEVDTAPHPIEDMSVPQTHPTTSKGAGKTFRGTTQQLFDQFLESFVSMVLPKNIDPNDSRSVEEMTSAMIRIFGKLKKMTEEDRTAFANTHGRQLTLLLPFIEAYTLPEKSRREQALSMIMGFNAQGQFNQE